MKCRIRKSIRKWSNGKATGVDTNNALKNGIKNWLTGLIWEIILAIVFLTKMIFWVWGNIFCLATESGVEQWTESGINWRWPEKADALMVYLLISLLFVAGRNFGLFSMPCHFKALTPIDLLYYTHWNFAEFGDAAISISHVLCRKHRIGTESYLLRLTSHPKRIMIFIHN